MWQSYTLARHPALACYFIFNPRKIFQKIKNLYRHLFLSCWHSYVLLALKLRSSFNVTHAVLKLKRVEEGA
jgi:hypothetical protein